MFQVLDSQDNYLGIKLSGKVDKEEYKQALAHLKQKLLEKTEVDILVDISELDALTMGAVWEDLKYDIKDFRVVRKLAVVGSDDGRKMLESSESVDDKARYFSKSEEDLARRWVH